MSRLQHLRTFLLTLLGYRTNFKAIPTLTTELINGAWNIFEYQYAQFDE